MTCNKFLVIVSKFSSTYEADLFSRNITSDFAIMPDFSVVFKVNQEEKEKVKSEIANKNNAQFTIKVQSIEDNKAVSQQERPITFLDEKNHNALKLFLEQQLQTLPQERPRECMLLKRYPFVDFASHAFCNSLAFIISQLKISKLDLSNNGITTLKQLFCQTALPSTNLEILILDNNQISQQEEIERPRFKNLKVLSLLGNSVINTPRYHEITRSFVSTSNSESKPVSYIPSYHLFESRNHTNNKVKIFDYMNGYLEQISKSDQMSIPTIYSAKESQFQSAKSTLTQIIIEKQCVSKEPHVARKYIIEKLGLPKLEFQTQQVTITEHPANCVLYPALRVMSYNYSISGVLQNNRPFRRFIEVLGQISIMEYNTAKPNQYTWIKEDIIIL